MNTNPTNYFVQWQKTRNRKGNKAFEFFVDARKFADSQIDAGERFVYIFRVGQKPED